MASYVYYKFRSQKEPQRVTIDGPYTDVWNLKREIISLSRLGDGTDFDLKIYKENTRDGRFRSGPYIYIILTSHRVYRRHRGDPQRLDCRRGSPTCISSR